MTERNTPMMDADLISVPVAASTKCEAGNIACANATGYAVPGSAAITLTYLGRFDETIDNSAGIDGALSVLVRRGKAFKFANSSGDAVDQSCIGKPCYIEDAVTVAKTDDTGSLSVAGIVVGVESDGIWVAPSHSHANQPTLDAITSAVKSGYDDAVSDSHTHDNSETLDAIEEALTTVAKAAYDQAVTDDHTHDNKTFLDAQDSGGATGSRPVDPPLHTCYYDTTLDKPIWCVDNSTGANVWKDATGTNPDL